MPNPERSDVELVAAFRAGDRTVFADIYDAYAAVVFSYFIETGFTRAEAADATHDALVEAATRLEHETPDDLEIWLLAVAQGNGEPFVPGEIVPTPAALRPRVLNRVEQEAQSPFTSPAIPPELVQMGIFLAVTIVVGLIGLAVSARFEPLDAPPPPPETTLVVAITTTTTTTIIDATTSTVDATTTTEALGPGEVEASTGTLDFGGDDTSVEFDLANTGGETVDWSLSSSSPALALSPGRGELAGGESVTIRVSLDRDEIGEGDLSETLTVTWSDGELEVEVTGSHEDNPTIHNPQASPSQVHMGGGDCTDTQTTISARVRDTSPLESVVVRWRPNPNASQETEMTEVGDDLFEAVIGPFSTPGTVEARIVAFDERGNAGGASTLITVVDCPDD